MLTHWLQNTIHHLGAASCSLCHLSMPSSHTGHLWCAACESGFRPQPRCHCCGLRTIQPVEWCGECLASPPPWHHLYCLGDYDFPLSQAIAQLKYQRRFWLARPLATLLTQRIPDPAPVLVPVPLHWRRYCQRGFNQSELIARSLARQLGAQCHPRIFRRDRHTASQEGLERRKRLTNLRQAFTMVQPPDCEHVAIVDDVVTTGSTVLQLCHLLLEAGVKRIDIYTVCRTLSLSSV